MKKMALILPLLPLATALLLSACDKAEDATPKTTDTQTDEAQTDNAQIDKAQTDNTTPTTAEKTALDTASAAPQVQTADNDGHKKDVIKFLYRDAVLSLSKDYSADELDTLFAYADRDLQNAIALVKADSMNTYEGDAVEVSDCSEVRYILGLAVGNGYSIDEAAEVTYNVLDNGNVRASILLNGDEDSNAADFDNYKDFLLRCSGDGCKITDIFDSYGSSALQAVEESCR